jgi:hypothetical protein
MVMPLRPLTVHAEMESLAFEKHYRVKDLAGLWGLSRKTVTRIFAGEAGVVRVTNGGTSKRKYATLSIPESVASRVHEKLGNLPLRETAAAIQPLRVICLRDTHAGLSAKDRNIIKLKGP